ncbi:signal peptidase I [Sandaracinobacteroides hominis]|uniref:signal peptidase I n=1 Tax=Sandaracinobacteroides hominis TaxID=2780086 RepID=UPI0018F508E6|nr:signal peptidase I [Sandaracinobacteroides hominis]
MDSTYACQDDRARHVAAGERLAAVLVPAIKLIGAALLIALALRSFVVQPFAIPSGSMSPELKAGDFVLVDKAAYGWNLASLPLVRPVTVENPDSTRRVLGKQVNAGDVVVFVAPDGRDYVKRVVASGGDRVSLHDGQLILNGRRVDCVPAENGLCREILPNGQSHLIRTGPGGPLSEYAEVVVPAGHYFVLGDNRNASADSRLSRADGGVGMVADGQIFGKASRIFFSAQDKVRWRRIGQSID